MAADTLARNDARFVVGQREQDKVLLAVWFNY